MLHIPGLYIQINPKGRGVYTGETLCSGDLIEICPIIKIPKGQLKRIAKTTFYNYYFIWEEEGIEACMALGYGSLYNHSFTPNAAVLLDYTDDTIKIEAIRPISSGDEILIDYMGGTKGAGGLWFKNAEG